MNPRERALRRMIHPGPTNYPIADMLMGGAILGFIVFIMLMSGCASMSAPQMSPEQLKAAAADKNFSAMCNTFTGFGGAGKSIVVNVDQRVVINGAISVSPDCVVTMSNMATVKPEPAKP